MDKKKLFAQAISKYLLGVILVGAILFLPAWSFCYWNARPSDAPFLAECILAGMPHLIKIYQSIGFIPTDHRNVFGTDFLRMIYTV